MAVAVHGLDGRKRQKTAKEVGGSTGPVSCGLMGDGRKKIAWRARGPWPSEPPDVRGPRPSKERNIEP